MRIPGFSELLLIMIAIVFLFGGKKLPELGTSFGEFIRNLKKALGETKQQEVTRQGEKDDIL